MNESAGVLVLLFGVVFGILGDLVLKAGKYQSWKYRGHGKMECLCYTGNKVSNVTIQVSDSITCVGGILGGGKEESEDSDRISSFEILDCEVSGSITGGADLVGNVVGNEDGAVEIDCTGTMIDRCR